MFTEIPRTRPDTPLLDEVNIPADLRLLPAEQLSQLAKELRAYLLYTVGQTGGRNQYRNPFLVRYTSPRRLHHEKIYFTDKGRYAPASQAPG